MPFNKKTSLHGYIDDNGIFGIIRSCQGLRLRLWNPLTDCCKKEYSYNWTKKNYCCSILSFWDTRRLHDLSFIGRMARIRTFWLFFYSLLFEVFPEDLWKSTKINPGRLTSGSMFISSTFANYIFTFISEIFPKGKIAKKMCLTLGTDNQKILSLNRH